MNIGDYLKALEIIGVKSISTSDIGELKRLYCEHVVAKPQRPCFNSNLKNKRTNADSSVSTNVKRIKFVRNNSVVKEVKTLTKKGISSAESTDEGVNPAQSCELSKPLTCMKPSVDKDSKPNLKRVQFSEDVTVSSYVQPKFKKSAVSWPWSAFSDFNPLSYLCMWLMKNKPAERFYW